MKMNKRKMLTETFYFNSKLKNFEGIDQFADVDISYVNQFVTDSATKNVKYILKEEEIQNPRNFIKSEKFKDVKSSQSEFITKIVQQISIESKTNDTPVNQLIDEIRKECNKKAAENKEVPVIRKTEEIINLESAKKWLQENKHNYVGKWVVLNGDKLIGAGEDPIPFVEDARKEGIKVPFMKFIEDDSKPFTGGWL